jgi:phosphate transport system permease protein
MSATNASARARSHRFDSLFQIVALAAMVLVLAALATLLMDVLVDGWPRMNWQFLTSGVSRRPENAGIVHALAGSLWVMALTGALALPIGVGAAIYLEEYGGQGRIARLVELNIANLAAVPSIIFGLLGLAVFVRYLAMDRSVLAGAATLALLVLPIVILSTREAIRAVPVSIREASYALGATKWQTVWHQVLPMALPGILTGVILALSRAMGETAPLVAIGALTYIPFAPDSMWSPFTVLPIQIFNWASRPESAFAANAAAGILVLLSLLVSVNAVAIIIRERSRGRGRG